MKISSEVKSGIYKSQKWGVSQGTTLGFYYLKIPNLPETREAVNFLMKQAEPAAAYFAKTQAAPVAWQWLLSTERYPDFFKWAKAVKS